MKKSGIVPLIISVIAVILLWGNYIRNDRIYYDNWRSDNVTGYVFQETPDYWKHLEGRQIAIFLIQEILIITSALLLIKGIGKTDE